MQGISALNVLIVLGIAIGCLVVCRLMGVPLWWGIIASMIINFVIGWKIPIWTRKR